MVKRYLLPAVLISICFITCTTDPCEDVICYHNGTCIDGTCDCPDGWTGTDCSIFDFDYTGGYTALSYSNTGCNDPLDNGTFHINDEGYFCQTIDANNRYCWVNKYSFRADGTWMYRQTQIKRVNGISLSNQTIFEGTYTTDDEIMTLNVSGTGEQVTFEVAPDRSHLIWANTPSTTIGCQTTHYIYKD